jgi:phenylalanyl-tRNA synthetase alpha chain
MDINQIRKHALGELDEVKNLAELEGFRVKYLGRKGELTAILRSLKDLSVSQRKKVGQEANRLKEELTKAIKEKHKKIENRKLKIENSKIDITAPGIKLPQGHLHPITQVLRQVEEIFQTMGFEVVEGSDIETEYYNFDALNIPENHPARDLWDTFWLKTKPERLLLKTHTSPMQVRYMEKHNPPLRIIVPGRCFRHEATDASHEHTFYQVEGLMVGKDISLANLKGVLEGFMKRFYGPEVKLRWQPSYFPFVEPGLELLVSCSVCKGKGCSTCEQRGWTEVIPCGMVHPNVFKAVGYNPANWQGFAFGMGLDRIAMMKYGINDIRLFYSGDLRFLKQF